MAMEYENLISTHTEAIKILETITRKIDLIEVSRAKIMRSKNFFYKITCKENSKIKDYRKEIKELRIKYINLITNNNTKTQLSHGER